MNGKILILGEASAAMDAVFAGLSADYDVRTTTADGTAYPDFSPDVAFLCLDGMGDMVREISVVRSYADGLALPVLVFAATADAELRRQLIRAGAADVFVAPFDAEEIYGKFGRLIRSEIFAAEIQVLRSRLGRLSQYFSVDVVEKIMSQKADHAYGENLEATIFFLDIRNFTTISENVEPNLVAALLNRLYTDIMDLILTYKGSVNKIIGDALLATFGCPVRGENDAENAVHCALAIRDTLKFFNETKPPYIHENISIGMGIATGPVFAGTIGSYRKMDYTVIGDTVNIAARLEGLTKQTKFDLIIDRKTRELAGPDLAVRKLKVNRVRGRTQPMEIFLVESYRTAAAGRDTSSVLFAPA
jgi:adenylate cyclase